ncbi:MAG: DUF4251 domain-containing protein [Bacteroidaceae bacterium]|nr:DUF4251 domain-containing protein [Bacteroidaceae bacterium]
MRINLFFRFHRSIVGCSLKAFAKCLCPWVLVLTLLSCASQQQRAERRARTQQAVAEALAARQLNISITSMSSARYGTRTVSFGFNLEVKGDTLVSYLPYVGRVYRSSVLSTPIGLNFEAPILAFQESRPKGNRTRLDLRVKTIEDVYDYVIEVYDSGKATIFVRGQYRDAISFDGDVVTDE